MTEKHVHIMMGLPGSGKTTYINEHKQNSDYVGSMDDIWFGGRKGKNATDKIKFIAENTAEHQAECYRQDVAWIDGLILTAHDIGHLVDMYIKKMNTMLYMFLNEQVNVYIHIHQYEENREYCKNNDIKRVVENSRDDYAQVSIDNMTYEVLTDENINDLKNILREVNSKYKLENIHYDLDYELLPVKKCGNWELYYRQPYNDNPNILKSASWSLGGSWCDYRGCHGSIEADKQPEFEELDNILLKTCPNISILVYKKIYKDYVEIEEYSENDYYGGTEYKAMYKADIRGIYDYLRENKLIEE